MIRWKKSLVGFFYSNFFFYRLRIVLYFLNGILYFGKGRNIFIAYILSLFFFQEVQSKGEILITVLTTLVSYLI